MYMHGFLFSKMENHARSACTKSFSIHHNVHCSVLNITRSPPISTVTTPIPKRGIAITARVRHDRMHERNDSLSLRKNNDDQTALRSLNRLTCTFITSSSMAKYYSHTTVLTDSKINMVSQHSNLTFQCILHTALQHHAPRPQHAFLIRTLR